MSNFRWFLIASMVAHALFLGARELAVWNERSDIRISPVGNSVSLHLTDPSEARTRTSEKETVSEKNQIKTSSMPAPLPKTFPPAAHRPKATPRQGKKSAASDLAPPPTLPSKSQTSGKAEVPDLETASSNAVSSPAQPDSARKAPEASASAQRNAATHTDSVSAKEFLAKQQDAPSYTRFIPPEYPPRARRMNLEGRVLLRVHIRKNGRAGKVEVVESSHPEFTKAAIRSARLSRYAPPKSPNGDDGVSVLIPFLFKLE